MKTLLEAHALSFSLSEHHARKQTSEQRIDDRATAGHARDLEDGLVAAIRFPAAAGAQKTWVLDHDVLELRYVN